MTNMFHVPKPPLKYLPRPDQLESLVALLLSDRPEAVGVVGVQGMGGIGKSVLAAAAVGEKRLHKKFPDGIYWLTVGQSPDIVAIQRQLARDLGVPLAEIQFLDAALGRSELENRLAGKAVLLCSTTSGRWSTPSNCTASSWMLTDCDPRTALRRAWTTATTFSIWPTIWHRRIGTPNYTNCCAMPTGCKPVWPRRTPSA